MKVIIDESAGFCSGVKRAIRSANEQLEKGTKLVALGPLIHNDVEINRLESKGLVTINQNDVSSGKFDLQKIKDKQLLIRTHGIGINLRNKLDKENIKIIDATCPTVRHVQQLIEKYHNEDYQIIIVGKKSHPEIHGLQGYCKNTAVVVSSENDIRNIDYNRKTLLVAQTTISPEVFNKVQEHLQDKTTELIVRDTTCNIINKRHKNLQKFADMHDVILFVGGKQSSNTRFLSELCRSINERTYLIEDVSDIRGKWFNKVDSVGITGGASTSMWQLQKVQNFLKNSVLVGH